MIAFFVIIFFDQNLVSFLKFSCFIFLFILFSIIMKSEVAKYSVRFPHPPPPKKNKNNILIISCVLKLLKEYVVAILAQTTLSYYNVGFLLCIFPLLQKLLPRIFGVKYYEKWGTHALFCHNIFWSSCYSSYTSTYKSLR